MTHTVAACVTSSPYRVIPVLSNTISLSYRVPVGVLPYTSPVLQSTGGINNTFLDGLDDDLSSDFKDHKGLAFVHIHARSLLPKMNLGC